MGQKFYWDGDNWAERPAVQPPTGVTMMKDIESFKSVVDGSWITSRSELRAHNRRNNVRQCGDDWTGSYSPPDWFLQAREEQRR